MPTNAQNLYDYLIFPDTTKKIIITYAKDLGKETSLLTGIQAGKNDLLAQKTLEELNFQYRQSVVRLNQCSRNFSENNKGPNILFISNNKGGFPRHGIAIYENKIIIEYPNLNYVDLVVKRACLKMAL